MSRPQSLESSTTRWYEAHVRRFGYGYRALGFGRRSSQEKRFAALLSMGRLDGRSLLDAGCGFGDFLAWLNARGMHPRYTGVDSCAPMAARGARRFAGTGARFVAADAMTWQPPQPFDYVVASGLFGLAAKDARRRIRPTLERLFENTRVGLAVNFLSAAAPRRSAARLYVDPAELLGFALQLTPSVRLDHTYMPNDFTLFLYRSPAWQEET
jgi:SAM-dependent methyltransferase